MNQVYCCVLAQPWIWSIFFLWNNQFEYRHADIVVNVEVSLSEKDPFYRAFVFCTETIPTAFKKKCGRRDFLWLLHEPGVKIKIWLFQCLHGTNL